MLKKARSLGMHAETRSSGATVFCWEDADIGTRFTTKKCATEAQLEQVIEQKELLRDQMRRGMTGSSSK
jgi:hypothetical protein